MTIFTVYTEYTEYKLINVGERKYKVSDRFILYLNFLLLVNISTKVAILDSFLTQNFSVHTRNYEYYFMLYLMVHS